MIRTVRRALCILALTAVALVLPSRTLGAPITIVDTFGPGQTFSDLAAAIAGANTVIGSSSWATALTPMDDFLLTDVTVAGVKLLSFGGDSGVLALMSDSSDQPGAVLEAWDVTFPSVASLLTFTSIGTTLLQADTQYWLAMFPQGLGTVGGWSVGLSGEGGLIAASGDVGATWQVFQTAPPLPAMQLRGDQLNSDPQPVPEPSTLLLIGSGLVLALRLRQRRAGHRVNSVTAFTCPLWQRRRHQ